MATSKEYIDFVCEQIEGIGDISTKPVLTVCDNTVFVKKLPELSELMAGADCGFPYEGAKEQYILDIENRELAEKLLPLVAELTPLPKPKKKKT